MDYQISKALIKALVVGVVVEAVEGVVEVIKPGVRIMDEGGDFGPKTETERILKRNQRQSVEVMVVTVEIAPA